MTEIFPRVTKIIETTDSLPKTLTWDKLHEVTQNIIWKYTKNITQNVTQDFQEVTKYTKKSPSIFQEVSQNIPPSHPKHSKSRPKIFPEVTQFLFFPGRQFPGRHLKYYRMAFKQNGIQNIPGRPTRHHRKAHKKSQEGPQEITGRPTRNTRKALQTF